MCLFSWVAVALCVTILSCFWLLPPPDARPCCEQQDQQQGSTDAREHIHRHLKHWGKGRGGKKKQKRESVAAGPSQRKCRFLLSRGLLVLCFTHGLSSSSVLLYPGTSGPKDTSWTGLLPVDTSLLCRSPSEAVGAECNNTTFSLFSGAHSEKYSSRPQQWSY